MKKNAHAYTLIQLMVVLAILALILGASVGSFVLHLKDHYRAVEDEQLKTLDDAFTKSLDSTDWTNTQIYPYADAPASYTPTNFYTNVDGTYSSTQAADWYAKLASSLGVGFTSSAPTISSQPAMAQILYNRYGRARLLVPSPTIRNGVRRFLLISLMEDPLKLYLPPFDGTQNWFDAVDSTDWTNPASTLPSYLASLMTAAQQAAWNPSNGTNSNLAALRVRRIVLNQYTFTMTNTSSTNNVYLSYNNNLNTQTIAVNTTATTVPIYKGRMIYIYVGTAPPPVATQTGQMLLKQNENLINQ